MDFVFNVGSCRHVEGSGDYEQDTSQSRKALLVQKDRLEPQDDLAHTLLRWQQGGVTILAKRLDNHAPPTEIKVQRPSRYKSLWYRVLAQLGLRRSSAGGFGSYIPEPTSAG
jgi:hypothetical protein